MQRKKQVSDLKNKIQKFSKGDFQLIRPDVIFDETNLVLIIGEGEVYRGSFTMKTNSKGTIRGLVYPSSFRVHFKEDVYKRQLPSVTRVFPFGRRWALET